MRGMRSELARALILGALITGAGPIHAAPFDLAGPVLQVQVTRSGRTLPLDQVPSLATGDQVSVKTDLSSIGSAHYLMVAAFLRGATDPPPPEWFIGCEAWTRKCASDGLRLTVPAGAEQLMVFLAPQTGGGFKTLVSSVRGRPGAFVRTAQELRQAALDHARLEAYLTSVRELGQSDPSRLKEAVPLLARSLALKVNASCLEKIPVLQAPCLAQGQDTLILDDGHSASLAQALTSGAAGDLAMEASNTPQLKSGYYGPFIGSIFDIAKILDSLHTAQYQYFPALAVPKGPDVALTLNAPPSFHDPKSVLVVALPAVEATQLPVLRAVKSGDTFCAGRDPLVLPVEGEPVVFATVFAHDLRLHILERDGSAHDLPALADPSRGGFVLAPGASSSEVLREATGASVRGEWGFDRYEGPSFKLVDPHVQVWRVAPSESADVIVGRVSAIHLQTESVSCLDDITLVGATGKPRSLEWSKSGPGEVAVTLPLQDAPAGDLTLQVHQSGGAALQFLTLHGFAQAGHLETFVLHAGDTEGLLRGNRLDEVKALTLGGVEFLPGKLTTREGSDELTMLMQSGGDAHALKGPDAQVKLNDGRTFKVRVALNSPRPRAALISMATERRQGEEKAPVVLTSAAELPLEARLTFSYRAINPDSFAHEEKLEVATADGSFSRILNVGTGEVMLESRNVAVVTLDPARSFGASAFGALQFRRIVDGVTGQWTALGRLVRVPRVSQIDCPADPMSACSVRGSNLFLLDAISASPTFAPATHVPDGFTQSSLPITHPTEGKVYVKLRDDPAVINVATWNVEIEPPAGGEQVAA